jgi:hypothetical protein
MSMTRNFAFGVEITLLMRIFAVVRPAAPVDLSPGYSIFSLFDYCCHVHGCIVRFQVSFLVQIDSPEA